MHRITSAAVLANPATRLETDFADQASDVLSGSLQPVNDDDLVEDLEVDLADDVPLLPTASSSAGFDGVTQRPQKLVVPQYARELSASPWHEAVAVLRLAAPACIQGE